MNGKGGSRRKAQGHFQVTRLSLPDLLSLAVSECCRTGSRLGRPNRLRTSVRGSRRGGGSLWGAPEGDGERRLSGECGLFPNLCLTSGRRRRGRWMRTADKEIKKGLWGRDHAETNITRQLAEVPERH